MQLELILTPVCNVKTSITRGKHVSAVVMHFATEQEARYYSTMPLKGQDILLMPMYFGQHIEIRNNEVP